MDAVIEFSHSIDPAINITKVMPSGRSKRGWVSYLLAAVDRRVFATYPEAYGTINQEKVRHVSLTSRQTFKARSFVLSHH